MLTSVSRAGALAAGRAIHALERAARACTDFIDEEPSGTCTQLFDSSTGLQRKIVPREENEYAVHAIAGRTLCRLSVREIRRCISPATSRRPSPIVRSPREGEMPGRPVASALLCDGVEALRELNEHLENADLDVLADLLGLEADAIEN